MAQQEILEQKLQESYHRIADYHRRLTEFFGVEDKRRPPRVATYLEDVLVFPNSESFKSKNREHITYQFIDYFPASYNRKRHYIYLSKENVYTEAPLTEQHEATHSVLNPLSTSDKIEIVMSDLDSMQQNELADLIKENLHRWFKFRDERTVGIDSSEFYAPLGTAYLSGTPERLQKTAEVTAREVLTSFKLLDIIKHLPQLAGEILVDQYHGDVKALMREHPKLPHLSGKELWQQYCMPLLTEGRLS
jgi:hypothetical protein